MKRTFCLLTTASALALVLAALVLRPAPMEGQAVITSTTTNAAMTATATSVSLTSNTGIARGVRLYIDGELMETLGQVGTTTRWNVRRGGSDGMTPAVAHVSGAGVWIFPATGSNAGPIFFGYPQANGAGCSLGQYPYQPFIDVKDNRIFDCDQGIWFERKHDLVYVADYSVRDSFDQGYDVLTDTGTVKGLTDTNVNFVYGSPLGAIAYREEQTKTASSWITINGYLDVSGDNTTSAEGVEIIWGAQASDALNQVIEAGTQGACISASVTVLDISGTNQVLIGWRDNQAWQDAAAYASYTVWSSVGITSTAGAITSKEEVSGATQTDDPGVAWADNETRGLKACVSKAGVPTVYYTAAYTESQTATIYPAWIQIPATNAGLTYTAGTGMLPYFSFLVSGTDGPDVRINWVELTRLP